MSHPLFGEYHTPVREACAHALAIEPVAFDVFVQDKIDEINRETAIGPLLNPTEYVDGSRFKNAKDVIELLKAMNGLVQVLHRTTVTKL